MWHAGGKGVYWTILVVLFGLSQLWFTTGFRLFNHEEVTPYTMTKDGGILFFTLAITMSVTMDYWFEPKVSSQTNLAKATAFVFIPIAVIAFVIWAYSLIFFDKSANNPELVATISLGSMALALIFAIIAKAYIFFGSN